MPRQEASLLGLDWLETSENPARYAKIEGYLGGLRGLGGLRCFVLTESFLTTFTALVEAWIDAYVDPSTLLVSLAFSKFLPVELGCPRLAGIRLVWAADSTLTGEVHVSHDASDA